MSKLQKDYNVFSRSLHAGKIFPAPVSSKATQYVTSNQKATFVRTKNYMEGIEQLKSRATSDKPINLVIKTTEQSPEYIALMYRQIVKDLQGLLSSVKFVASSGTQLETPSSEGALTDFGCLEIPDAQSHNIDEHSDSYLMGVL